MKHDSRSAAHAVRDPLAIIGMGCRFPGGADHPDAFWDLLCRGDDGITEVPKDRWDLARFYDPDPEAPGKMYVKAGGFLRQPIDRFDALFFGMSPREAMSVDPQQRLLLEVAWEALEDAGLAAERLAGTDTGVFVGAFMLDNMLTQLGTMNRELIGAQTAVSSTMSILSNRISYVLDLRGPSLTLDTACSSSLVAVHQACQALWRGECSMVLAGGVNVMYRPENPISMCKGQFLAPDGRCKSFDARADGYGRGEGAGLVVLKPLSAAMRDGDRIHALVCASGVNQDGRTNGITVPNPQAQAALVRAVVGQAGVDPRQIRYVEAHGTGTALGDPLEARALGSVVGQGRAPQDPCYIGSVKANIGHLEAASGIAGLIKSALCLKHRQVPPLANLRTPNPAIDFAELGLRLPLALEPLPEGEGPAYVGVNSFGYGGTNAHVILREPPPPQRPSSADTAGPCVLPISARSPQALRELALAHAELLSAPEGASLPDLCYSAGARRAHHDHRFAVVASSKPAMAEQLRSFAAQGQAARSEHIGRSARPVFVFTGMGPQWWAMGRDLLACEPVFRREAQACDEVFRALAGWSILDEMAADEAHSRIGQTHIAQPANFVLQAGLSALWRSWGVEPAAAVGHSVGEVSAAYVAGALNLEDAVRVSYHRSRIQKKAAGLGAMLAAGITSDEAMALLADHGEGVSIAAVNSPSSVTLAGDAQVLSTMAESLAARGAFNRFLKVEVAYHSPYMEPLLPEVRESLQGLRTSVPQLPLYSTVSGHRVTAASHDAQYWCANVRQPVAFRDAMNALVDDGHQLFLEVGPHPVLSSSIKECVAHRGVRASCIASLRRGQPERATLLEALGALYTAGCPVDWQRLYPQGGKFVSLPSYPWQRETYWNETPRALLDRLGAPAAHAFLQDRVDAPHRAWDTRLNAQRLPYLADHQVDHLVVLPGAAYVEAGLAVHKELHDRPAFVLEDLEFHKALVIEPGDEPVLRVACDEPAQTYGVYSRSRQEGAAWTLHASGRLSTARLAAADPVPMAHVRDQGEMIDAPAHYDSMRARGLQYGAQFRGIRRLWRHGDEVLAQVHAPEALDCAQALLHPALLDACFQSLIALLDANGSDPALYLPVAIRQLRLHGKVPRHFWSHGRLAQRNAEFIEGHLQLSADDGTVFAEVRGLRCVRASSHKPATSAPLERWLHQLQWHEASAQPALRRTGTWLVFMDEGGLGQAVAERLQEAGASRVIRVESNKGFGQHDAGHFQVGRHDKAGLRRLWDSVGRCDGVVSLWGLDVAGTADDPSGMTRTLDALHLLQTLGEGDAQAPRCYFVTRNMQQVRPEHPPCMPSQAPLAGLARVALNEHPQLHCTTVDLDPQAQDVGLLAEELLANRPEDEVAFRGGKRYANLLAAVVPALWQQEEEPTVTVTSDAPCELSVQPDGKPVFRQTERRAPGAGEVEIRIHAVVLTSGDGAAPCAGLRPVAGVVSRVGSGVLGWREGDPFVALLATGIGSYAHVLADAWVALPQPDGGAAHHQLAAWLPFVSVHHGLCHAARLQRGETVLVIGAQVSTAAIQVARRVGARVIVAVDRDEEHEALRAQSADVVLTSDTAEFSEQVLAFTAGHGVDVLLHALDTAPVNLALLAPQGRFVQMAGTPPDLSRALERGLVWVAAGLPQLMATRPQVLRQVMREVHQHLLARHYQPEAARVFEAAQITDALAARAKPSHGVVVSLEGGTMAVRPLAVGKTMARPDGCYLITGGFGGFGLKIAQWLVEQGARHLVLAGRRGAVSAEQRKAVQALEARGVRVMQATVDVGDALQVRRLIDGLHGQDMPPLRGVMHTAAVLDDAMLGDLDAERLERVMRPKALGAWHLHCHTQHLPLDFFVLFSSVSALIGNASQGNYAAANAFLDALAHHRRARGLPAISIDWGVLGEVGMAAAQQDVQAHLQRMGIRAFTPAQAMDALGRILQWNPAQICVVDADWRTWAKFSPATAASPRFAVLVEPGEQAGSAVDALRHELQTLEPAQAKARFCGQLAELVAATLKLPRDKVNLGVSLAHMGGDSLMALELQAGVRERFGIEVSSLELMKEKSLEQLAEPLLARLLDTTQPHRVAAPFTGEAKRFEPPVLQELAARDAAALRARLDELSDSDVERLLASALLEQEAQS